jgi:hypothetical protein
VTKKRKRNQITGGTSEDDQVKTKKVGKKNNFKFRKLNESNNDDGEDAK